jgi:hypothetical protein
MSIVEKGSLQPMTDAKSNGHEPVPLEEFIKGQQFPMFLATIEEVKEDPILIKVTPWRLGAGCSCKSSLLIPKEAIESVKPTGDTHYCCGKVLRVGEVRFKPGAKVGIEEVFTQMMQSAGKGSEHGSLPDPFRRGPFHR